jgi:hypothetical protein
MSCIIGAIAYCTAAITIPGPIHSAQSYQGNDAWRYAAYYGPPVLSQYGNTITLPAYANPNPTVFPTIGGTPYYNVPRGAYRRG